MNEKKAELIFWTVAFGAVAILAFLWWLFPELSNVHKGVGVTF